MSGEHQSPQCRLPCSKTENERNGAKFLEWVSTPMLSFTPTHYRLQGVHFMIWVERAVTDSSQECFVIREK
jgi:hypothetical protein